MNTKFWLTIAAAAVPFFVAACGGPEQTTTTTEQTQQSQTTTQDTSAPPAGSGSMVTTPSGLKYQDITPGSGASPKPGQQVTVHYTGWLTNGKKFDSSVDNGRPFTFTIGQGQVIKGWDEGVATMKVGGRRKLVIPANLGYGSSGAGEDIPPDSTLVFDVQLLGVQ